MFKRLGAVALAVSVGVAGLSAQAQKPARTVVHDVTIKAADSNVYSGTLEMAIVKGKVSGDMRISSPTPITGKVAGTSEAGVLKLDFPYHMTEQACDGNVKMNLKVPATPGPITGTMEATGCGMEPGQSLTGTVEMTVAKPKK